MSRLTAYLKMLDALEDMWQLLTPAERAQFEQIEQTAIEYGTSPRQAYPTGPTCGNCGHHVSGPACNYCGSGTGNGTAPQKQTPEKTMDDTEKRFSLLETD